MLNFLFFSTFSGLSCTLWQCRSVYAVMFYKRRYCWHLCTLLYEMVSNCSVIWSGRMILSSLVDRGWEEVKASTANTRWMSSSTIKSFWSKQTDRNVWRVHMICKGGDRNVYSVLTGEQQASSPHAWNISPHSSQAQHSWLPGKTHMWQSPHSARPHSTTAESPGFQTTASRMTSLNWLLNNE